MYLAKWLPAEILSKVSVSPNYQHTNALCDSWLVNFFAALDRLTVQEFRVKMKTLYAITSDESCCELCSSLLGRSGMSRTVGLWLVSGIALAIKNGKEENWLFASPVSAKEILPQIAALKRESSTKENPGAVLPGVYVSGELCEKCERTISLHYLTGSLGIFCDALGKSGISTQERAALMQSAVNLQASRLQKVLLETKLEAKLEEKENLSQKLLLCLTPDPQKTREEMQKTWSLLFKQRDAKKTRMEKFKEQVLSHLVRHVSC